MPHELDDIDVAIVTSLQEDGRKSFRQIARELDISTPPYMQDIRDWSTLD